MRGFEHSLITSGAVFLPGAHSSKYDPIRARRARYPSSEAQEGFEHSPITSTRNPRSEALCARAVDGRIGPSPRYPRAKSAVGIEILDARGLLSQDLLAQAD
jgi:hypothetical protein